MSKAWMPLYIGDYLGDTSHLSQAHHGAYLLLMMHYWQKGMLQASPKHCFAVARAHATDEQEAVIDILREFFTLEGEQYRHTRIDKELSRITKVSEGNKEKARKAANARWNAPSNAPSIPQAMLGDAYSQSHSESQSHIESKDNFSLSTETADTPTVKIPYEDIRMAYNKFCPSFAKATELNDARRNAIRLRWMKYQNHNDGPLLVFDALFKKAEASDFVSGRDGKWSGKRGFDWLLNAANMVKVLEGNYDNGGGNGRQGTFGSATGTGTKAGAVGKVDGSAKQPGFFAGDFVDKSDQW